jgi:hypothetical protein
LFAAITLGTTLNATGLPIFSAYLGGTTLEGAPLDIFDPIFTAAALPGTLATVAILGTPGLSTATCLHSSICSLFGPQHVHRLVPVIAMLLCLARWPPSQSWVRLDSAA